MAAWRGPGSPSLRPPCSSASGVEGAHGVLARRAQAHVHAGVGGDGRHLGAQVQPELGILLAEADRGRALDEPREAEWRQQALVEGGTRRQIADGHGDVVDHARSLACN